MYILCTSTETWNKMRCTIYCDWTGWLTLRHSVCAGGQWDISSYSSPRGATLTCLSMLAATEVHKPTYFVRLIHFYVPAWLIHRTLLIFGTQSLFTYHYWKSMNLPFQIIECKVLEKNSPNKVEKVKKKKEGRENEVGEIVGIHAMEGCACTGQAYGSNSWRLTSTVGTRLKWRTDS